MTRTFIDSGVLLAGWRGKSAVSLKALTSLADPKRAFISSPFVRLEVLPKAICYQNRAEVNFYNKFFDNVSEWVDDCDLLAEEAMKTGSQYGLSALGALHVAAALLSKADEFITAERPTSPLSRVQGVRVISIA
jgi:predicted nucleic acid-binding protein